MANNVQINYDPVSKKLEEVIKRQIKADGLVKTGSLYNSIKVLYNGKMFTIEANDYYVYLDDKHKITQTAIESPDFVSFLEQFFAQLIENNI